MMSNEYPENIVQAWEEEPDVERLWDATDILKTDTFAAIEKLKVLADEGSVLSMVYIGDAYLYGRGVKCDPNYGEKWMRRAADNGSIEGRYRLARYYQSQYKFAEAKHELFKLVERKFSPAMYILGVMYYEGDGVDKNISEAMKYWTMAEKNRHLIAKQAISIILRSGSFGLVGIFKGYIKLIELLFFGVALRVRYPESDRLRYR